MARGARPKIVSWVGYSSSLWQRILGLNYQVVCVTWNMVEIIFMYLVSSLLPGKKGLSTIRSAATNLPWKRTSLANVAISSYPIFDIRGELAPVPRTAITVALAAECRLTMTGVLLPLRSNLWPHSWNFGTPVITDTFIRGAWNVSGWIFGAPYHETFRLWHTNEDPGFVDYAMLINAYVFFP